MNTSHISRPRATWRLIAALCGIATLAWGGQPPLQARFEIPAGHTTVSVVVDDAQGVRVRNLLSMQPAEQFGGDPTSGLPQQLTVTWDGLADDGTRTPAGTYSVRGLSLPGLKALYERSFYNPGTPPWHGYPNSHWGSNHGDPVALACVAPGDGSTWRTVVGCNGSEGTDFIFVIGKDGRKQMGWQMGWGSCQALAIESNALYAAFGDNLKRLAVGSGRSIGWARSVGSVPDNKLGSPIAGLAVGRTQVAVVLDRDKQHPQPRLVILDKRTGTALLTNVLDRAYRLTAGPGESVYGTPVEGGDAVRVDWDGTLAEVMWPEVELAGPLAFDRDGLAYVMDLGADCQVKVFSPLGDLVRTIGKRGGARDGYTYDPTGLHNVKALAIDDRGFLWTTEGSHPRRQAAWDLQGTLVEQYVGSTWYGAMNSTLHDQDPDSAFLVNLFMHSDPAKTQDYRVERFFWSGPKQADSPFSIERGLPWAFFPRYQFFRSQASGAAREYGVQTSLGYPILYVRQDDGDYRPRAAMWVKATHPASCPWSRPEDANGTVYVWSDLNGDELRQDDETVTLPDSAPGGGCGWAFSMPPTLEWFNGGYRIAPAHFQEDGAPVYTLQSCRQLAFEGFDAVAATVQHPPDRPERAKGFMIRVGKHLLGRVSDQPKMFTGRHIWMDLDGRVVATRRFPGAGVHGSMAAGVQPPGETLGELFVSGVAPLHRDLGWAMAFHGNYGQVFFLTEDGIFISSLFRDTRDNPQGWGAEVVRGRDWSDITMYQEAFTGWFGRQTDGKYRYVFGHTSANVVEIQGLEAVRAFKAVTLEQE